MSNRFKTNRTPFVIAGPCSVENQQQLRQVATELTRNGRVDLIRCGVWKPRSRPGGFEGLGEPALGWMAQLKRECPELRFCCEVAMPEHVELCLQYGIDTVWIGARTTANPFLVGELCNAMQGTGMAVMVKNPPSPDMKLWTGAIERLAKAGIDEVAAIHRGFALYNNAPYRNTPLWEIPMDLKRTLPDLPIFCDPSHMAGRADLVAPLAQMAADLQCDGLMIEVHPNPSEALTDAQQQLTPAQLADLLNNLKPSSGTAKDTVLQLCRERLDTIDRNLIDLLAQRFNVVKQIAQVKIENNISIYQPTRWEQVLQRQMEQGARQGLNPEFVKEIYDKIHTESVNTQLEIKNSQPHKADE